ncbi:MAG TPA: hypothetical protein PLP17_15105, partial [Oligoflexia bacterium]|nr:hypothetical protein [Oligoflexia bacterium]
MDAFALLPALKAAQNLRVFRKVKYDQEKQQRHSLHRPCATSAFTQVMPQICAIQRLSGRIPDVADLFAY